jgi:hypothetical protein
LIKGPDTLKELGYEWDIVKTDEKTGKMDI